MRLMFNHIRDFARDERGAYSIMFLGVGTFLLLGSAMSIDIARLFSTQNKLAFAVDAAALATTQGLTQGDIELDDAEEWVRKYIDANLDGRNLTPENVKIDDIVVDKTNKTVEIDAHTIMPMTMAGIVGYHNHRVEATTKAKYSDTNVEVAMALDVTGSMGWKLNGNSGKTKLQVLKSAAKSAIDILYSDSDASTVDQIRVGLVPYSEAVNAHPVIDKIQTTGLSKVICKKKKKKKKKKKCWTEIVYPDCVAERTGPEKYTDHFAGPTAKITSSEYDCPSAEIVPLSADKNALKSKINAFSAGGNTAGHIAIAWAYYMLSSKWNAAWPVASQATDYDEPGSRKYAIIMTDGEFNTFETAGQYGTGATSSRNYALGLCNAMKSSGIKVYSIAFAASGSAKSLMQDCASTSSATSTYFYDATDENALEDAFKQIASDIKGLRLVN